MLDYLYYIEQHLQNYQQLFEKNYQHHLVFQLNHINYY
jgi:hypothetical protein